MDWITFFIRTYYWTQGAVRCFSFHYEEIFQGDFHDVDNPEYFQNKSSAYVGPAWMGDRGSSHSGAF